MLLRHFVLCQEFPQATDTKSALESIARCSVKYLQLFTSQFQLLTITIEYCCIFLSNKSKGTQYNANILLAHYLNY